MTLTIEERISLINESAEMIKLLFGWKHGEGIMKESATQFGMHGLHTNLWTDHIIFLEKLNSILEQNPNLLNIEGSIGHELINRWKYINNLIITSLKAPLQNHDSFISNLQTTGSASILGFFLLEEIARIKSNKWDMNGFMNEYIDESWNLQQIQSDGTSKVREYKKGKTISLLSHKLIIMHKSLSAELQQLIESLDNAMRKSFIQGLDENLSPLYERLEYHRNQWSHGRKFSGWEGIFLSLFICFLYFEPNFDNTKLE